MSNTTETKSWLERHIPLHSHDSPTEELVSAIIHGLGVLLVLAGGVLLGIKGSKNADHYVDTGYLLFSVSMLILYLSSTLYHLAKPSNLKRILRIFDHMSIYLLIAGTYSPIMLSIRGGWGWSLLAVVWGLALLGMGVKIFFWQKFRYFHLLFYLLMGWLVVLGWKAVFSRVSPNFLYLVLSGGISYTLGTVVYSMKKLPFYHGVWHLFVLGGSICLFLAIYLYI